MQSHKRREPHQPSMGLVILKECNSWVIRALFTTLSSHSFEIPKKSHVHQHCNTAMQHTQRKRMNSLALGPLFHVEVGNSTATFGAGIRLSERALRVHALYDCDKHHIQLQMSIDKRSPAWTPRVA